MYIKRLLNRVISIILAAVIFQSTFSMGLSAFAVAPIDQEIWESVLDTELEVAQPINTIDQISEEDFRQNMESGRVPLDNAAPVIDEDITVYRGERFIIKYQDTAQKTAAQNKFKTINNIDIRQQMAEEFADGFAYASPQSASRNGRSRGFTTPSEQIRESLMTELSLTELLTTTEVTTADELASELAAAGIMVSYVQPDYEMYVSGIEPSETSTLSENEIPAITDTQDPEPVQIQENTSGTGIIVALLDTGIETTHPALQAKLDLDNAYDFVNKDSSVNDSEWIYEQGHATHLAGVIASDEYGTATGATVLPLKVFQGGIAYTSDIIAAIAYAELKGARIANCSWGSRYENQALYEAIEQSGMLFVTATGNQLVNIENYPVYPASFDLPNVLSVSSVSAEGKLSRFSNYGVSTVDIAVPGEDIPGPWILNGTVTQSGTSVSAAAATAGAAVIAGALADLDASELRTHIIDSADTITGLLDKISGGKRLNTTYALSGGMFPNPTVIVIDDDEPLPDINPGEPAEDEEYELYGADGLITYRASMPTGREGLGVVAVGDKIYAIGGQVNTTYYNRIEVFDTKTNTWATITPTSGSFTARSYFVAVAVGTRIYCIGGRINHDINTGLSTYTNSVQIFNTANNSWSNGASLTVNGSAYSAMAMAGVHHDGNIYVSGGFNSSFRNNVYRYNISSNSWVSMSALNTARAFHAAFIYGGYMYIEGGCNSPTNSYVNSEERYTLSGNGSSVNSGVSRFSGMNGAVIARDERAVFVGGSKQLNSIYMRDIMQFSMTAPNNVTNKINTMLTARAGHGAVMVDGSIYMIGGRDNDYIYNTVEVLEGGFSSLQQTFPNELKDVRDFKTVEMLGSIYVLGGTRNSVPSRDIFAYNIHDKTWSKKPILLPFNSNNFAAASLYGKLYTSNGSDGINEYDPQLGNWRSVIWFNPPPVHNLDIGALLALNGKLYFIVSNSTQVITFNPVTGQWGTAADLPMPVDLSKSTVLAGKIYIFADNTILVYDPTLDSWETRARQTEDWHLAPVYDSIFLLPAWAKTGSMMSVSRYWPDANTITEYSSYLHGYNRIINTCTVGNVVYSFVGNGNTAQNLIEYMPTVNPWLNKSNPTLNSNGVIGRGMAGAKISDKMYMIGGYAKTEPEPTFGYRNFMLEYDLLSDTWTQRANMPTGRSNLAAATVNGKVYAIAGQTNSSTATNVVEEFTPDSSNGVWSAKNVLPYSAHSLGAAASNGKIYTFGGKNGSTVYDHVYEYDPAANSAWISKSDMPNARYGMGVVEYSGKIYVIGGYDTNDEAQTSVDVYDPAMDSWSTIADLPEPRAYMGIAADNGIYVINGTDGFSAANTVFYYNFATLKWHILPGADHAVEGLLAFAGNDGVYFVNGETASSFPSYCYFAPPNSISVAAEYLHYGKKEVNISGNMSRAYTDMSYSAPGFDLAFSRTYNSRDERGASDGNIISRGWTFGFQGKIDDSGNNTIARLPNGSALTFRANPNGSYTALDSRAALVKNGSLYTLTTKDQYQYSFNASGYLITMSDPNGNAVTITLDSEGKPTEITDQAGRETIITYIDERIATITDPIGRVVTYDYDSNNRLSKVTDPTGMDTYYTYDSNGYLNSVKNHNSVQVEGFTYETVQGDTQLRLKTETGHLGLVQTYTYYTFEGYVRMTDSKSRVTTTWFDKSLYPIQFRDAEGRMSRTEYFLDGSINRYGEISVLYDRNGGVTHYERDDRGNIINVVDPNGNSRSYTYDAKNNVTSETDESGKRTYFVYDANNNLLKTAKPLTDATPAYTGSNDSQYAITVNTYTNIALPYGRTIFGLLNTVTDPENGVTSYSYDNYGYVSEISNPLGYITQTEFNTIGWLKQETTSRGFSTSYYYDKAGRLLKKAYYGGETERNVYNILGQLTQQIGPRQYASSSDTTTFTSHHIVNAAGAYTDTTHGTRTDYLTNGLVGAVTNELNHTISFTYDSYGNILTETLPNGAVNIFTYDVLNRQKSKSFRESVSSPSVLLEETEYLHESRYVNSPYIETQVRTKQYLNASQAAITTTTMDWAGRITRIENPDGTVMTAAYNANGTKRNETNELRHTTYYDYDALNRLIGTWVPRIHLTLPVLTLYSYTGLEYDKAGRITRTFSSKNVTGSTNTIPTLVISSDSVYNANGMLSETTDPNGGKTTYFYDADGNMIEQRSFSSDTEYQRVTYSHNHLNLLVSQTQYAAERDIYGMPDTDNPVPLTSTFSYDLAGNVAESTDALGISTSYTYDLLNRQTAQSRPGIDENGSPVTITTSQTLDWMGNAQTATDELGNITQFEYDVRGNLIKTTNALDGVSVFGYDRADRLIAEVSPKHYDSTKTLTQMNRTEYEYDLMGRVSRKMHKYIEPGTSQFIETTFAAYEYDAGGNVTKQMDAEGYLANPKYGTTYTYAPQGRVLTVLDPVSAERNRDYTIEYTYDPLGRKTQERDAAGYITTFTYDDASNLLSVSASGNGGGVLKTNTYDKLGRLLTETDANGFTTSYTYNAFSQVRTVTLPGDTSVPAHTIQHEYDKLGRPKSQTDSLGKQKLASYDSFGRVLSETTQASNGTETITTSYAYDKKGNLLKQTDALGNIAQFTYDALGRGVTKTNPLNQTATYTYDANGNLLTETDWRGNSMCYAYDPLNRLISTTDPYDNIIESLTYDKNGAQITSTDALGHTTTFTFDKNGRQVGMTDPLGYAETVEYDNRGNISTATDPNGNITHNFYDRFNRLIRVESPLNTVLSSYSYDLMGNLLTQTDGAGKTVTHTYNARSQLITRNAPGSAPPESYTYRADGLGATSTDRNGLTTTYQYDIHGRLLAKSAGNQSVSYTYDANGNELSMTDNTGTTTRNYDVLGRVVSKYSPNIGTSTFTYDILANVGAGHFRENSLDPMGNMVTKEYDKLGRLYSVTSVSGTATYEYYANGSQKKITYPNDATAEYTYYANNRLHKLTNKMPNSSIIDAYQYTYDPAGNRTQVLDAKGTTTYTYDYLSRLETVTEPDGRVTSYTFDSSGNRATETMTLSGQTTVSTYSYDMQNRMTSVWAEEDINDTIKVTDYYYDANGNMTGKLGSVLMPETPIPPLVTVDAELPSGADSAIYEYDAWNNLISSSQNGIIVENTYNGNNLRVSKSVDHVLTRYLYEYDEVILELSDSGAQLAQNVYGMRLLTRNGQSMLRNGHGDVTAIVNGNEIVASYYYDAFGVHRQSDENGVSNPFRYSGYMFDDETGLYYLKARFYDPETARFLQEDSFLGWKSDPLSLNRYTYVHNNPVRYWDPTGHYLSPTDMANLSIIQLQQLMILTDNWNAAKAKGDTAGMAAANNAANAIRATAGYSGGTTGNEIIVKSNQTVSHVVANSGTTLKNNGTVNNYTVLSNTNTVSKTTTTTPTTTTGVTISKTDTLTVVNIANGIKLDFYENNGIIGTFTNNGTIGAFTNNGTIGAFTNNGTITTMTNNGTIGKATNSGKITTLVNHGNITEIKVTNSGKINKIDNRNIIDSIVLGQNKSTTIINTGFINGIATASGTVINVSNHGLINNIFIGRNGTLDGSNYGYVGDVNIEAGGKVTNQWTTSTAEPRLLMTNEFIKNSLLTTADRNAGVGVSRIGGMIYKDFTNPVNTALSNAEAVFGSFFFRRNHIWFVFQVDHDRPWDIKVERRWNEQIGLDTFPGRNSNIVVNGQITTPDRLGNVTYGYLGTACGFKQYELLAGGDFADGTSGQTGLWNRAQGGVIGVITSSDSEQDKADIRAGIQWYNNSRR